MKKFLALVMMAGLALPTGGLAQDKSGVPEVSMFKMMLDANKSGWVAFREYDGRQFIYFTNMLTSRCRLKEIRYSVNADSLDQTFDMPACIPDSPFMIPSDGGIDDIALTLEPGTAKTITVQAVFEDDSETEILTFRPCEGVGDSSCAKVVE
ncbi:hypothetical protein MXMO3_00822 [Maritalea myrionectae]|uniref:Uncharacterized protein n=1 Tax=Maritalea myrionectae TaxID=454601 RepID=A0A2R4MBN2_9HYPH|nr:hypothetical protein [Maritalea myrionectae]AVX03354.1 hypothetical protein MXMO3_00822 [Maritalea myrionectae]